MPKLDLPVKIKTILLTLQETGHDAYVVGGCVRDIFLGKEPHDWDITTSATPSEIQKIFINYQQILTGLKHGTVMVVIENELIEITTFRIDGQYSDGRRPDQVSYTKNIKDDLSRRDYTINACATDGTEIIDPFGGHIDADNRIIRCVGEPVKRFEEDSLRILRGIRFASVLNFSVEENTKSAMFKCSDLLKNVSIERITAEFCKIIQGSNVKNILIEFKDILAYIIPEIKDTIGFRQNNPYHIYDVFEHTLKAVETIESDHTLRLAMFFHDIGKPSCYTVDEKGVGHFYGHPDISARLTEIILKRMKFSNDDIRTIVELVKYHDIQIGLSSKSVKKLLNAIGEQQFRRLLKIKKADIMAQNPSRTFLHTKELNEIERIFNDIVSTDACIQINDLAINGNDLIKLGIKEGKQIGLTLKKLHDMVLEEELENNREALLQKATSLQLSDK